MNSEESIRTAARMLHAFGSWSAIERAAEIDEDGIYVVRRANAPGAHAVAGSDRKA